MPPFTRATPLLCHPLLTGLGVDHRPDREPVCKLEGVPLSLEGLCEGPGPGPGPGPGSGSGSGPGPGHFVRLDDEGFDEGVHVVVLLGGGLLVRVRVRVRGSVRVRARVSVRARARG